MPGYAGRKVTGTVQMVWAEIARFSVPERLVRMTEMPSLASRGQLFTKKFGHNEG